MAQAQTQQRRQTEQERIFTERLTARGYTDDQARQILDIVQRLRSGQNVQLNAQQSNWVNDINAIMARWNEVSGSTTRLSQLNRDQVGALFHGTMLTGPERPVPRIAERPAPAPVRTFVYEVTVDDRTYRVETNRELTARGMTTVQGSRIGQFRTMLREHPEQVLAITTPEGAVVRPGTEGFADFTRGYVTAYNAMLRNPDEDRISIASVRRPRPAERG